MTVQVVRQTSPSRRRLSLKRQDKEFLPAALELLETPPSPISSALMITICGFAAIALAWAYFGTIDIIAVAQGKVQPVGGTKVIQPLEAGKVSRLLVQNGKNVQAGDVLLELDPNEALADEATLESGRKALEAESIRRRLALTAAAERRSQPSETSIWPADVDPDLKERERRVLEGDLSQLAKTVASLGARQNEKLAEQQRLKLTIEAQQLLVSTLKERVDMRATLLEKNSGSKASLIDAQETHRYHAATLAAELGQLGEVKAALDGVQADIEKTYASFVADNSERLAQVERDLAETNKKLARSHLKTEHMTLRSPIAGTVQGLTVTTMGQVINAGDRIMQIVPRDREIEVEAYLPNGDAGFVKAGQNATVKVESFPFTRYGTLDAAVTRIASDSIPSVEADRTEGNPTLEGEKASFGGAQRLQNLVYPVALALEHVAFDVDGASVPLIPGMAVTVEIKTGHRRILEYLFSPLVQIGSLAMKER